MKIESHTQFLAAIAATLGKQPDDPETPNLNPVWDIETDAGRLRIFPASERSATLNLAFTTPGNLLAVIGANPHTGRWDIAPPMFEGELAQDRGLVIAELSRRLARVGYVAPDPYAEAVRQMQEQGTGLPREQEQGTGLPREQEQGTGLPCEQGMGDLITAAREFVAKAERIKEEPNGWLYKAFKDALALIDGGPVSPEDPRQRQQALYDRMPEWLRELLHTETLVHRGLSVAVHKSWSYEFLIESMLQCALGLLKKQQDLAIERASLSILPAMVLDGSEILPSGKPVSPEPGGGLADEPKTGGNNMLHIIEDERMRKFSPAERTFLLELLKHERPDIGYKVQNARAAGLGFAAVTAEEARELLDSVITKLEQ